MLSGDVFTKLKHDIIQNTFKPDQKLLLSDLKNLYQTGTSPVREALFQLHNTGFVTSENQKGFRVAPMSVGDCGDLCTCLADLQQPLLKSALKNGGDAWEAGLAAKTFLLQKSLAKKTPDAWQCLVDLHAYYQQLWMPAASIHARTQHQKWFELLCRYLFLGSYKAGFMTKLLEAHCRMSEHIHAKNMRLVAQTSREIFDFCFKAMKQMA